MLFFKKKNKVDLIGFCTEYYGKYFLEPTIGGVDMSNSYTELIVEKITELDNNFKSIEFKKICDELLILRFELFSLAWFHQFGDKSAIQQSIFTKIYLLNKEKGSIWDGAESYNQAIAHSATHGCDSSTAFGRGRITFVNSMRSDLFKKYYTEGLDMKCVARVLNKYGTDERWKKLAITLEYLVITLCENLSCKLNQEAQFYLMATLKGLYDGSKQNLKEIKIIS